MLRDASQQTLENPEDAARTPVQVGKASQGWVLMESTECGFAKSTAGVSWLHGESQAWSCPRMGSRAPSRAVIRDPPGCCWLMSDVCTLEPPSVASANGCDNCQLEGIATCKRSFLFPAGRAVDAGRAGDAEPVLGLDVQKSGQLLAKDRKKRSSFCCAKSLFDFPEAGKGKNSQVVAAADGGTVGIVHSVQRGGSQQRARSPAGCGGRALTHSQLMGGREVLPVLLQNLVGRGQPSAGDTTRERDGAGMWGDSSQTGAGGLQPSQGTALWPEPHPRFLDVCHNEGSGWGWERALHTWRVMSKFCRDSL